MAHPVLFLDIDEVLCFTRVRVAMPGAGDIDPVSAAMVVRICERTGARIVVTSTWRCSPARCSAMFDAHGLTPHLWSAIGHAADDWRVESQNHSRSRAIDAWLADHPSVTVWAIVDDSCQDFDAHKMGRLVHTDMMFGLGLREFSRAVRLLGGGSVLGGDEDRPYQHPRHTISNLAVKALAALDEGDDDAVRAFLTTIRDEPLAQ